MRLSVELQVLRLFSTHFGMHSLPCASIHVAAKYACVLMQTHSPGGCYNVMDHTGQSRRRGMSHSSEDEWCDNLVLPITWAGLLSFASILYVGLYF